MTTEEFDDDDRKILDALIGAENSDLLASVDSGAPTQEDRRAVMHILSDAFMNHLGPDWQPDPVGVAIDNLLGKFLQRWPIDA